VHTIRQVRPIEHCTRVDDDDVIAVAVVEYSVAEDCEPIGDHHTGNYCQSNNTHRPTRCLVEQIQMEAVMMMAVRVVFDESEQMMLALVADDSF